MYETIELLRLLPKVNVEEITKYTAKKLSSRHFTHETVSFGEMRDPQRAIIHVSLEELISNGLLELIPEMIMDDPFLELTGLYQLFLWLKTNQFRAKPRTITLKELKIYDRLAALFKTEREDRAPFWMFLNLLSVRRRTQSNPAFREWVLAKYQGQSHSWTMIAQRLT